MVSHGRPIIESCQRVKSGMDSLQKVFRRIAVIESSHGSISERNSEEKVIQNMFQCRIVCYFLFEESSTKLLGTQLNFQIEVQD